VSLLQARNDKEVIMNQSLHATALVVFGATGDLTQNKLYPALYELARRNLLPKDFYLYGIARESMTRAAFEKDLKADLRHHYGKKLEKKAVAILIKHLRYIQADLADVSGYLELEEDIKNEEKKLGHGIRRVFYLALPPSLFSEVVQNVNVCKLGHQLCTKDDVKSFVVLEKPFGYDLKTAQKLHAQVKSVFDERQVYRIDHYLGKEAFQNIFSFRFANALFEPLWNNKHIKEIQINALETVGLDRRFAYYDGAGALRDMVQNHLMQFLAHLTMSKPSDMSAKAIRRAKASVLKKVRPYGEKIQMVRGQYRGYKNEEGIPKSSRTETFAAVKLEINSSRWRGVPIYIRTGKNLTYKETSVNVVFRSPEDESGNIVNIQISPIPSVSIKLNVQAPGFELGSVPAGMHYCRGENTNEEMVGDYERLLLDVFEGDQRLFTSAEEVLAAWKVVMPFLKQTKKDVLRSYLPGSMGPKAADVLLKDGGSKWAEPITNCPYKNK
jgi:glucose-6-phosphate 1-dehydrogenase